MITTVTQKETDALPYWGIASESLTRNNQLVARYGGEEFALILPDADIQEAIRGPDDHPQCIFTAY